MDEQLKEKGFSTLAAERGEPSYVWRDGQERRFRMIIEAAEGREQGIILENGCGVGMYLRRLAPHASQIVGLEVELDRAREASALMQDAHCTIVNSVGEALPFPDNFFDLILSHEVLEHVQNDRECACEMVRCLKQGGRIALFCPNRGYPFETHGIYWCGKYYFGNKPFVNYLPRAWRDHFAPHVNVYTRRDLEAVFSGLPVRWVRRTVVFGAYDNLIARFGKTGKMLRAALQWLEKTPLRRLGLSHFWVIEKIAK